MKVSLFAVNVHWNRNNFWNCNFNMSEKQIFDVVKWYIRTDTFFVTKFQLVSVVKLLSVICVGLSREWYLFWRKGYKWNRYRQQRDKPVHWCCPWSQAESLHRLDWSWFSNTSSGSLWILRWDAWFGETKNGKGKSKGGGGD